MKLPKNKSSAHEAENAVDLVAVGTPADSKKETAHLILKVEIENNLEVEDLEKGSFSGNLITLSQLRTLVFDWPFCLYATDLAGFRNLPGLLTYILCFLYITQYYK